VVLFKELLFFKKVKITSFVYVFNTINGMYSFLGGVMLEAWPGNIYSVAH
jgi:hypothetical protein